MTEGGRTEGGERRGGAERRSIGGGGLYDTGQCLCVGGIDTSSGKYGALVYGECNKDNKKGRRGGLYIHDAMDTCVHT